MKRSKAKPVPRVQGRVLLVKWFEADRTRTRAALGERLGITGQAVSGWLRGIARPDLPLRALLQHSTGIPADAWMTAREKAEQEAAVARALGDEGDLATGTEG